VKKLARGDRLEVEWWDVFHDPVANPDAAHLFKQTQIGFYWGVSISEGIPCLVLTSSFNEEHSQDGFIIIPDALVASIRKLRRSGKKEISPA
jgi:hypothetical protein